jgi:hypothetical protein
MRLREPTHRTSGTSNVDVLSGDDGVVVQTLLSLRRLDEERVATSCDESCLAVPRDSSGSSENVRRGVHVVSTRSRPWHSHGTQHVPIGASRCRRLRGRKW